jgi:hypothetical protein
VIRALRRATIRHTASSFKPDQLRLLIFEVAGHEDAHQSTRYSTKVRFAQIEVEDQVVLGPDPLAVVLPDRIDLRMSRAESTKSLHSFEVSGFDPPPSARRPEWVVLCGRKDVPTRLVADGDVDEVRVVVGLDGIGDLTVRALSGSGLNRLGLADAFTASMAYLRSRGGGDDGAARWLQQFAIGRA